MNGLRVKTYTEPAFRVQGESLLVLANRDSSGNPAYLGAQSGPFGQPH